MLFRSGFFGPATIVVRLKKPLIGSEPAAFASTLGRLPGSLTCSVFAEPAELGSETWRALAPFAGRIILNGVPTGVRVDAAMVHSGPFPACNRPDSTAVGPRSLERWVRTVCIQG